MIKKTCPFFVGGLGKRTWPREDREVRRDIAEQTRATSVRKAVFRVSRVVCEIPIFGEPLRGSSTEHIQHMQGINLGQMYQQLIDFWVVCWLNDKFYLYCK